MNNNNYQELLPYYNLVNSATNAAIMSMATILIFSPEADKHPTAPCLFSAGAILLSSSSLAHRAGLISLETNLKLKAAATAVLTAASFALPNSIAEQKPNPSL